MAALPAFVCPAAGAAANHIQCGAVITQSTSLDGDVVCESREPVALTIGADGITLDLNGHRVEYRGSVLDDAIGITGAGVARRDVTIANGTITGFRNAISFTALTRGTIRGVQADGAEPIRIDGAGNVLTGSSVTGFDIPVAMRGPDNSILDNDITADPGIVGVLADSNVRITENRVFMPEPATPTHHPVAAIQVSDHRGAVIAGNTVGSPVKGIYVFADSGAGTTVIEDNLLTETRSNTSEVNQGITVEGSSLVRRNTVTGFFDGIVLNGDARAVRNTVRGNYRGIIGRATTIENNDATGNASTGISTFASLVRGNVANQNGETGIAVAGDPDRPVTVTRNTANFNGRYGIQASNAIDGGGNRAKGNAFSPQCLGVVCK